LIDLSRSPKDVCVWPLVLVQREMFVLKKNIFIVLFW
jgi:hypothetical protein